MAVLLAASALAEAQVPTQSMEVSRTERVKFQPGGTIRVVHSYGYLSVEGWDEPEVEVTITKSTDRFFRPKDKEKADRLFEEVRVAIERGADKELSIATALPVRNSLFTSVLPSGGSIVTPPLPPNNERGVTVEYTIHIPRDSRLVVHHDNGYVWVSEVTGDLEVHSHTGDMIVMLPGPGPYSIDARTGLGRIVSDLAGKDRNPFLVGAHLVSPSAATARHIFLRMGRGSVTVKTGPSSGSL